MSGTERPLGSAFFSIAIMSSSAPLAVSATIRASIVVNQLPQALPVEDDERDSPLAALHDVIASPALSATIVSSGVHFALIILLALLHIDISKHAKPPVIAASVAKREPIRPELHKSPELKQPTAAAGPKVRAFSVPSAPQLVAFNVGNRQVMTTLPSLNDMVLRDAVRTGGAGGIDQVSFFGATSYTKRVVFVVDNSQSMKGKKFERCKEELLTAVSNLSPRQQFYVIFFSDKEHPMLEPDAPKDPLNLDTKSWESFHRWVDDLELKRGTRAKSALVKAFELEPDVIFLLTDGQFTDKTYDYLMGLEETKVKIHTIGFQARAAGAEVLQAIAKKFGGEYTDIGR
jgi:hypothetical protein